MDGRKSLRFRPIADSSMDGGYRISMKDNLKPGLDASGNKKKDHDF